MSSGRPLAWPITTFEVPGVCSGSMLLANQVERANRAKGDRQVIERGTSPNHSTNCCRLMAAAVARCWRWVFTTSRYWVRRIPEAKTAWEMVPSTPGLGDVLGRQGVLAAHGTEEITPGVKHSTRCST
jgi:hypothetical protein